MAPQEIWTCSEMIRRTEALCQQVWTEISLWKPIARKVMGEPLLESVDKFGIFLEAIRGNCAADQKKKTLKDASVFLLQARRCLIRALKRGVIDLHVGQTLLDDVETLRYQLSRSLSEPSFRRAA